MPIHIHEDIRTLEERLRAEKAIAERFPDASLGVLPDGNRAWMSDAAQDAATDFEVRASSDKTPYVLSYVMVEGLRVYARNWPTHIFSFLETVKHHHAEAYKILVNLAAKG